jgi:hypothetical protein
MIGSVLEKKSSQHSVVGEFSSILASALGFLPSLNYPIRSYEHVRRNRQADLLRGFEIDNEFELRRLLNR